MTYVAAETRYDSMPYRRVGRSGLKLPAISLGLWHNFGDDKPFETERAILRRAFDLGVTHFDLANNYGPPPGSAEDNFGRHLQGRLPPLPRRADHLHQGRLRHVARARTANGARASTCSPAWTSRSSAWAWTTSTSSTATAPTPTRRWKRPWAPWTTPCAPGKALYAGISSYTPEQTREARPDPEGARHPAADPPAQLLHVQPLDRERRPTCYEALDAGGRRLHRVLAAGAGHADRPLPERHPGRFPRRPGEVPGRGQHHRGQAGPRARTAPDRRGPRADPRADGHRLDPARAGQGLLRDLRPGRRVQRPASSRTPCPPSTTSASPPRS